MKNKKKTTPKPVETGKITETKTETKTQKTRSWEIFEPALISETGAMLDDAHLVATVPGDTFEDACRAYLEAKEKEAGKIKKDIKKQILSTLKKSLEEARENPVLVEN